MNNYYLSIVIPSFRNNLNAEELFILIDKLNKSFSSKMVSVHIELIIVDDNNEDNMQALENKLSELHNTKCMISLNFIKHAKNYGKHRAIYTGIIHSTGSYVLIIDEDFEYNLKDYTHKIRNAVINNSHGLLIVRNNNSNFASKVNELVFMFVSGTKLKLTPYKLINRNLLTHYIEFAKYDYNVNHSIAEFSNYFDLLYSDKNSYESSSSYNLTKRIKQFNKIFIKLLKTYFVNFLTSSLIFITFIASIVLIFLVLKGSNINGWSSLISSVVIFGSLGIINTVRILKYLSESSKQKSPIILYKKTIRINY